VTARRELCDGFGLPRLAQIVPQVAFNDPGASSTWAPSRRRAAATRRGRRHLASDRANGGGRVPTGIFWLILEFWRCDRDSPSYATLPSTVKGGTTRARSAQDSRGPVPNADVQNCGKNLESMMTA